MNATVTEKNEAIKEQLGNLNESNIQLFVKIGKRIVESNNKIPGGILNFLKEVANETGINVSTVNRIYYTYIKKMSLEELESLVVTEETNQKVHSEILLIDKKLNVYSEDGLEYFSMEDLYDVLPISRNNKAFKNSFVIRSKKSMEINGEKHLMMEVDKTKTFLQNYLRHFSEGQQKNELRFLIDSIILYVAKGKSISTEAPANIVSEEKPLVARPVIQDKVVENSKPKTQEKVQEDAQQTVTTKIIEAKKITPAASVIVTNEEATKTEQPMGLTIDMECEMKTLTKLLNGSIGYLSNEAKEKLYKMTTEKGLVNTVLASQKMLNQIQNDTSLYFVNMIEQNLKECL